MHPNVEQLSGYASGVLAESDAEQVARHVADCHQCEGTLQQIESQQHTLIEDLRRPAPEDQYATESGCQRMLGLIEQIGIRTVKQEVVVQFRSPGSDLGSIGNYRLLAKLGQGGMGAVYKALHTRLERIVALKVLPSDRLKDEAAVARFSREMKAVGRLDHAHIVRAMDAGDADGTHFLVMEYVQGVDLSELVAQQGPLPVDVACELIRQAAIGLQHAHEHGLVHRDIKPSNLMLCTSPAITVKVLDLGLALLDSQVAEQGQELTGTGQLMGTADYMAPEQATDTHRVDIRADIYSLGITLYKLLAGVVPFAGERYPTPISKIMAHATQPVASIRGIRPDIPRGLEEVIAKMVAKKPEDRYATPQDVVDALAPFAAGANLEELCAGLLDIVAGGSAEMSRATTSKMRQSELDDTSGSSPSPLRSLPTVKGSVPQGSNLSRALEKGDTGRRKSRRLMLILAGCAALAAALAGVVLSLRGPDGEVIVELGEGVAADEVAIAIKEGGKEIEVADAKDGWTIQVREGKYEANLKAGRDRFVLAQNKVEVRRGEVTRVQVTLKPMDAEVAPTNSPLVSAEPPAITTPPGTITPSATSTGATSDPLSTMSMVTRPATLKGLKSWSIETRSFRSSLDAVRRGVCFSPDASRMAAGGDDGTVRILDARTGDMIRCLVRHSSPVTAVNWSSSGTALASGDAGGQVVLWDLESGKILREFSTRNVKGLEWSPDGSLLAVSGNYLDIWDVARAELINPGSPPKADSISWHPSGNMIAAHSTYGPITLVDPKTRKLLKTLDVGRNYAVALAWSPDGKQLAFIAAGDKPLQVWNPDANEVHEFANFTNWNEFFFYGSILAWSPDGKYITASGYWKGLCQCGIWDAETRSQKALRHPGGQGEVRTAAIASDGALAAMTSERLMFWPPHELSGEEPQNVTQIAPRSGSGWKWAPDGQRLAHAVGAGSWRTDGLATVLNLGSRDVSSLKLPNPMSLEWSRDGRLLVVSCYDKPPMLLDAASLATLTTCGSAKSFEPALSPDGTRLALTAPSGKAVEIWDTAANTQRHQLTVPDAYKFEKASWSPDGKRIAAGVTIEKPLAGQPPLRQGPFVMFWNAEDGQPLDWHLDVVGQIAVPGVPVDWSSDGKRLLTKIHRGFVVFDLEERKLLRKVQDVELLTVAWGADDSRVRAVRTDASMEEWSIDKLEARRQLGKLSPTRKAAFRPGGAVVLTGPNGGSGNTLWLWEVSSGSPQGTFLAVDEFYLFVSPIGHYMGSEDVDNYICYVAETEDGCQNTYTPAEFQAKFGWKNDPAKAWLP